MRTNELLNELEQNTIDSFTQVGKAGGTIPQETTLKNLPEAIGTIPQAQYPEYGRVAYYPTRIGYEASGSDVTINSVNETKLTEFLTLYPPYDTSYIDFMFEPEWDPETGQPIPGTGSWRYYWKDGDLEIAQADFASTTGIDCTITSQYGYGQVRVSQTTVADTEADLLYAEFASVEQFRAYTPNATTYTGTIGEATVQANCIKEVQVGTEITSLPNYFMAYTSILDTIDFSQSHITSIGNYFLSYAINFNQPINLPECSSIGTYFLQNAKSFNQTVSLPNVTTIPNYFLRYCPSFNQPISLTGVTTIGTDFLGEATSFNKSFTIPATVSSIGNNFLRNCNAMIGTVTIETPATAVQTPSTNFYTLSSTAPCYTTGITFAGTYGQDWFNKHIPLNGPENYRKILGYSLPTTNYILSTSAGVIPMAQSDVSVLCSSSAGTASITFANGTSVVKNTITEINFDYAITTVGDNFCNGLYNMTTLTMPNAHLTSVGINFLASTSRLTSRIDVSDVTDMPTRFLAGCRSENVVLPASVSSMGDYALNGTRIVAPLSIEVTGTIGNYVLSSCVFLEDDCDITITGTCSSIGNYFLYQCSGSKTLTVTLPPTLKTIGTYFIGGSQLTPTLSLPNTVTSIGERFLYNLYTFNSPLTLPSGLKTIGAYFMYNCNRFNQPISMPQGLTTIGNYFMYGCSYFNQELRMPQTLTSVGTYFMYCCDRLTTAVIMGGLAPTVFASDTRSFATTNKTAVVFTTGFPINSTNFSGFQSRFGNNTSWSPYRKLLDAKPPYTSYLIANNTRYGIVNDQDFGRLCNTSSASGTFQLSTGTVTKSTVTEVHILHDATTIGNNFLQSCTSLQVLELPNTITSIGNAFLSGCTTFNANMTLPTSLTTIGNNFMFGCVAFNSTLTLPNGLTTIGKYFLAYDVAFNKPVTLPNTVTTVGEFFLGMNASSTGTFNSALTLSTSLTSIDNYFVQNQPYFNQPITIPASVKSIGNSFLLNDSSFNSTITFAGTVDSISSIFLKGCSSFNQPITVKAKTIDHEFMYELTAFNQPVTLVDTTSIDYGFMSRCRAFNSTLTLPNTLLTIGDTFLAGSSAYNQDTVMPSSLTSVGKNFMQECDSYAATTTLTGILPTVFAESGMSFVGTYQSTVSKSYGIIADDFEAWHTRFPDSSGYRRLTDASVPRYGAVTHYPVTATWSGFADNGETVTVAQDTFANFVSTNNIVVDFSMGITITADYQQDWEQADPETGEAPFIWTFQTKNSQYVKVQPEDLATTTGISITLADPTMSNRITMTADLSVDRTATAITEWLRSGDEFDSFANNIVTVNGRQIPTHSITNFTFGPLNSVVPANFMNSVEYYDEATGQYIKPAITLDTTNATNVTTINGGFFSYTNVTAQAISFPKCSMVRDNFMRETPINCPVSLDKIGQMWGSHFLYGCSNLNSAVSLANCTMVKEAFMANCSAFNATLTLPKLKTMSGGFLRNCTSFNQPLTFSNEMETVGIGMLNGCSAFNQDLYFPSTLKGFATGETSDLGFMYGCISMTSTVTWDVDPSTMYNKNSVSSAFSCNSSTADCYVQGIKVAGTKATEAMTLWPNSTRSPYRNLVAA